MGYSQKKVFSGCRGRPSFDIPKEQIELFLEYNFSLPQISEMLGDWSEPQHCQQKTKGPWSISHTNLFYDKQSGVG